MRRFIPTTGSRNATDTATPYGFRMRAEAQASRCLAALTSRSLQTSLSGGCCCSLSTAGGRLLPSSTHLSAATSKWSATSSNTAPVASRRPLTVRFGSQCSHDSAEPLPPRPVLVRRARAHLAPLPARRALPLCSAEQRDEEGPARRGLPLRAGPITRCVPCNVGCSELRWE